MGMRLAPSVLLTPNFLNLCRNSVYDLFQSKTLKTFFATEITEGIEAITCLSFAVFLY